jgi:hypothetical protein
LQEFQTLFTGQRQPQQLFSSYQTEFQPQHSENITKKPEKRGQEGGCALLVGQRKKSTYDEDTLY